MTELEKVWQDIDRAIGYIQGFLPTVWALTEVQTSGCSRDIVTAEAIGEYDDVVKGLATQTARLRELYERNAEVSYGSVRIDGDFDYLKCEYDVLDNERHKAVCELRKVSLDTGSAIKKLSIALGMKWNASNAERSVALLQKRLIHLLGGDDGGADIRDSVLGLRTADIHDRISRQMEEANGEE